MQMNNSMRWTLTGNDVDWSTKTSGLVRLPEFLDEDLHVGELAHHRLGEWSCEIGRIASASAGLELPATSLIAPLFGRIAISQRALGLLPPLR